MHDPPHPPNPSSEKDPTEHPPQVQVTNVGFYVYTVDRKIVLSFEEPVSLVAMRPGDAIRLGKALFERGRKALKGAGGKLPKA